MNRSARLLYIEDDDLDRRAFLRLVREKGLPWEVTVAETLAVARAQLATPRFDIIVADYHLPDGDSSELFDEIPDMPFVLLTGTLEEELALRTLERGADDYLAKDPERRYLEALPFTVEKTLYRKRIRERERRLARQLRETEERFRLLVEGVKEYAIFMLDPQGRIVTWNSGAQRIKGYTAEEILGQPFSRLYAPEEAAAGKPQNELAIAAQAGQYGGDGWRLRKDGSRFWASVTITALRDPAGELQGFTKIVQDLTERKRAEEALKALNETLEQRVDERTADAERRAEQVRRLAAELTRAEQRERRRLAGILHDHLQQLLVGAKLGAATLHGQLTDESQRGALQKVDDLLSESLGVSRDLTIELSPPILREGTLAAALHWLAGWMHDKHGLQVHVKTDETVNSQDEATRILLFESVRELLFNIVKHAGTDSACATLERYDGEGLRIIVADAGAGFDPRQKTQHDRSSGGFGLFSIHERLGLIGGRIDIDSAPGQGTRVTLVAPL